MRTVMLRCAPRLAVSVWVLATLAACVSSGTMTPLNDAATAVGAPQVQFTKQGTGFGPVTVTMPDGEVLRGSYSVATGGGFAVGSATAVGPGGAAVATGTGTFLSGGGPVWVSATGPRTVMTCQAQVGFGHGGGLCRTNEGAEYQLLF